ncbi:SGNH hydrolase-type esterase domain-containing protein [Diplogelasinospora grovesii]|uniref:SGNH hydrolase-type esterase domain-containing protein n=1 Tax=Diplogelasinospora grovesii TaxID=303347 RepID=A0AAN6MYB2_9PEZI|nr:SGNH hydrolase-type esterase domain-containing protein [Diplogelasinospora grovesii]
MLRLACLFSALVFGQFAAGISREEEEFLRVLQHYDGIYQQASLIPAANATTNGDSSSSIELRQSTTDPTDFSWIRNWAAIGDSYTAGIGSGNLFSTLSGDVSCSRYDWSYANILNSYFGPSVANFYFRACSGANSQDILAQVQALPSGLDLVVMSSGGNDLCLTAVIWNCILSPLTTSSGCQGTIQTAQNAIDNILYDNVLEILQNLDNVMNTNGIVVYNLYSKFFDTQTEECANNQNWVLFGIPSFFSNSLTSSLRQQLNTLVDNANSVIEKAIAHAQANAKKMTLISSNWEPWVTSTGGTFCMPGSSPFVEDPGNANVLFYKTDTPTAWTPGILCTYYIASGQAYRCLITKRDELAANISSEHLALLDAYVAGNITDEQKFDLGVHNFKESKGRDYLTPEEQKMVDYARYMTLEARINGPACSSTFLGLSIDIPDSIGKLFHPNEKGHETIASFTTEAIIDARAKILGVTSPGCSFPQTATCFSAQGDGYRNYASRYAFYSHTAEFCSDVASHDAPSNAGTANWVAAYTYNQGTADEVLFELRLSNGASAFDEGACNRAVNLILDSCDVDTSNNAMGWKQGGQFVDGSYTYTVGATRTTRPWPYPQSPTASCSGSYKFLWDSYTIYGTGWAGWDYGQQSLRPNASYCLEYNGQIVSPITQWKFTYYDDPSRSNGWEWVSTFRTTIWTKFRCFANNKVQIAAGGPSNAGCGGSG